MGDIDARIQPEGLIKIEKGLLKMPQRRMGIATIHEDPRVAMHEACGCVVMRQGFCKSIQLIQQDGFGVVCGCMFGIHGQDSG